MGFSESKVEKEKGNGSTELASSRGDPDDGWKRGNWGLAVWKMFEPL